MTQGIVQEKTDYGAERMKELEDGEERREMLSSGPHTAIACKPPSSMAST